MLTLPQQNLIKIISQSSPMSERMRNNGQSQATESSFQGPSEAVEKRLEHWSQVVGKGDHDKFSRRLEFEGWDVNRLRSVLETTADFDGCEAEALSSVSWGQTFQEILVAAKEQSRQENCLNWVLLPEKKPRPFEAFYAPFLQVAIRKLHQAIDLKKINYLTESAKTSLYSGLLDRLAEIATPTLFREFSEFRSTDNPLKNFFSLQFQGRNHRDKYDSFLKQLFQDNYYSLFETYPVLGKLLSIAVDFWVEMAAELLDRLGSDWAALSQQFSQTPLQQVIEIQTSLSDPHNRGRSTLILTFENGVKVVYKPKDLGTDVAFFGTLQWCNDRGLELPFQCLTVLNRGHYGWIEHVPKTPCEDEAAIDRFYQRSGMLLCLIYVLEGTDCHHENLIACGEQPILIDTETLLTPRMAPTRSDSAVREVEQETEALDSKKLAQQWVEEQLSESVIRTMLLPHWDIIKDENHDLDLSGFGGGHAQQLMGMQWRDVNTDAMQLEVTMLTMEAQGNAPTLKDLATDQTIVIDPQGYLDAIVIGFESMYQFLLQHRSAFLDPKGPLQNFENETLRYVFRATNTYAVTLQQSYQPDLMKSGIDRSIALEVMSRAFVTQPEKPNFYPFLSIELQAMEQIDIPFFTFDASSRDVRLSNGEIVPEVWIKSGLDQVRSRIENLSPEDLQQQSEVIRGTFDARFLVAPVQPIGEAATTATASETVRSMRVIQETGNSKTVDYVQAAIDIAEQLRQTAILGDEESITWRGLSARPLRDGFNYGAMGVDLFSGSCGIGLFFAALAQTTGDLQWKDLALKTVRSLRDVLPLTKSNLDLRDRWVRNQGISGTTGIAGIVYGLSQMSVYLEDPSLKADAEQFAQFIRPETSNRAPSYSVARGVAGTILGLLAIPDNADARRMAVAAGEYLVQTQGPIVGTESKVGAWVNATGNCPVGFYDGIAGIAYALLRLFQVTQDEQFRSAALEAIEVERQLIEIQQPPVTWAQGAVGIGLARLGSLSIVDTPELRQEIESALMLTQASGIRGGDSLCWGNFGRLELLQVAAEQFDRPELRALMERTIAAVIQQADDRGRFEFCPDRTYPSQVPGLFTGLAGVGYQLLRMQNPGLSSVLLWDAQG